MSSYSGTFSSGKHSRVDDPLFQNNGGTPVTHSYVTGQLTFILQFLGI